MKRSEHPLSPFNPNWKSPIDWRAQNLDKQRGNTCTANVNKLREQGKEIGTVHGITTKVTPYYDPRKFTIRTR